MCLKAILSWILYSVLPPSHYVDLQIAYTGITTLSRLEACLLLNRHYQIGYFSLFTLPADECVPYMSIDATMEI